MLEKDLKNLNNNELVELLAILEGMDNSLVELEKEVKEGIENDRDKL